MIPDPRLVRDVWNALTVFGPVVSAGLASSAVCETPRDFLPYLRLDWMCFQLTLALRLKWGGFPPGFAVHLKYH